MFGTQKAYFQEDLFAQHLHRKFSWKNECLESIEEWKVAIRNYQLLDLDSANKKNLVCSISSKNQNYLAFTPFFGDRSGFMPPQFKTQN